jgi:hypothetical protein
MALSLQRIDDPFAARATRTATSATGNSMLLHVAVVPGSARDRPRS